MPRPERPIDPDLGPAQRFAAALRQLRTAAGSPPYRDMAATAHLSKASLSAAASGHRLPTWEVTRGYVLACGGDLEEWHGRWQAARADLGMPATTGPLDLDLPPAVDGPHRSARRLVAIAVAVLMAALATAGYLTVRRTGTPRTKVVQ